jgi:hypothetical protein
VVYIREAHAIDGRSPSYSVLVEEPITDAERAGVARTCMAKMALRPMVAVVDGVDNKVDRLYRGHPDRLFLVGKDGKIAYSGARGPFGFRPEELADAIQKEVRKNKAKADRGKQAVDATKKK